MNAIRLKLVKSNDSLYHVYAVRFSSGNTPATAQELASRIQFPITQSDSTLYLPKGFAITVNDKFRNQQVLVVVEVPINKKIEVDRNLEQYKWFNISMNGRRGWNIEWDDRWDNAYYWNNNKEYVMGPDGLRDLDKEQKEKEREEERKRREMERDLEKNNNQNPGTPGSDNGGYRYRDRVKEKRDTATRKLKDSIITTVTYEERLKNHTAYHNVRYKEVATPDIPAPLYTLLKVFQ